MAGRRRTASATDRAVKRNDRDPMPPVRRSGLDQPQRVSRPQRRREGLTLKLGAATDPIEELAISFDYARGAARRRSPDQVAADQLLKELQTKCVEVGDALLAMQAGEEKNP